MPLNATSPRAPSLGATSRSPRLLLGVLLVLALVGCGTNSAGDADAGAGDNVSSQSSPTGSSMGDTHEPSRGDPIALGIDTVEWPGDLKGAQAVFDQMPEEVAGLPAKPTGRFYGPAAGVHYGPSSTGLTAWVMGTDKQIRDPRVALGVMFGMGLVCVKGTDIGTAPLSRWGTPEIDSPRGSESEGGLWWFACDFESESDAYKGHAIGWVSGDLGWLVTTTDQDTTRAAVSALHDASG